MEPRFFPVGRRESSWHSAIREAPTLRAVNGQSEIPVQEGGNQCPFFYRSSIIITVIQYARDERAYKQHSNHYS